MSWIPGWGSIAAATWWSSFYFWAGIVALLALGISEVISHRYNERKDELVSEQQDAADRAHAEEIARLHLETADANARAAEAQRETERLKADNLKMQAGLRSRRIAMLGGAARAEKFKEIAKYPGTVALIQPVPDDWEAATLARDISVVLSDWGWKPTILSKSDWLVSPGVIAEGVQIKTVEEFPFTDNGQPKPQKLSNAGHAAQALVAVLNWDLGPPHGPALFGAMWEPEDAERPILFGGGGSALPKDAVIVLVGSRPLSYSLQGFSSKLKDPAKP